MFWIKLGEIFFKRLLLFKPKRLEFRFFIRRDDYLLQTPTAAFHKISAFLKQKFSRKVGKVSIEDLLVMALKVFLA